jgi:3-(3-hydroxy-phenyl)propionate hydroxylase
MSVFDVALIGCGPAGATLANLLGQYGLSVLVLEREPGIYPLPRAIHFDGEVMRVFETAGLRAQVEAISRPGLKGMHFNNAQGQTLMIRAGSAPIGPHGCANNHYFHQPELEAVLRQGLQRHPSVQLRTGHEVRAIEEGDEAVTLHVQAGAGDASYAVQARYVVGCDGARSLVRKHMGSTLIDLGLHQPWLVFDVLLKTEVPQLPEYTVQHCDTSRPMTYCNVTGNRRRWEIMLMPGDDPEQMVLPAHLWKLLERWVRPDQADIERAAIYTFHSVIAQGWRRGRLLLAGDSAHQTPPFLGQGMCAAIRDAANLAWKLDAVLHGQVDDALLDSYESERSPHVRAFIDLAVRLGNIIQTTDPEAARQRDERFRAGGPEIFHLPVPRLGPGIWCGQEPPAAQIFPQPALADDRLLDSALGRRFAVIGARDVLDGVSRQTQERWHDCGLVRLSGEHPELQRWLQQHGAQAVMLRPDRYILGLARCASDLERMSELLPRGGLQKPVIARGAATWRSVSL